MSKILRPAALMIMMFTLGAIPATVAQTDSDEAAPPPRASEDLQDIANTTAQRGAAAPAAPLEDYEASEQISEDLSVSFPVDI